MGVLYMLMSLIVVIVALLVASFFLIPLVWLVLTILLVRGINRVLDNYHPVLYSS
jgi:hypothetical protein